jgi:uncharacterized membrane protein
MTSANENIPTLAGPGVSRWRVVIASTEGRLLAAGVALALALAAAIGVGLVVAPDLTMKLATVIGLSLVIGIAAGISYGFAAGLAAPEVMACNVLVESLQVLVVYPLFLLAWRQLIDVGRMSPMLGRLRAAAQARQGAIRRWGIVGLFAFVFVPFWMTGPVVGAIIGFLLGMSHALILGIVLSASVLGVVAYAALFGHLNAWAAASMHPYAVFGSVVALGAAAWLVRRMVRPTR